MPCTFSNVVAFDDAPFAPSHRGDVQVVGAVYAGLRLDGVLVGRVRRDGVDSTRRLAGLVSGSRFAEHVQLIMLQGITLAGFNVVDLHSLHDQLHLPILAVARQAPDLAAIQEALRRHVPGGARKWALIDRLELMERAGRVFVQRVGLSLEQACHTIDYFAVYGYIPEPLRTAHLIAGALGHGQSRGRV